MTTLEQNQFDAAMYWADKPIKKFVCTVRCGLSGKTQVSIYGAKCSDRAAELALDNCEFEREAATVIEVRLATPEDLGCMPTTAPSLKEKMLTFAADHKLGELRLDDSHTQLLIGNLSAIAAVNQLREQHTRLGRALVECLGLMNACEKHRLYPRTFEDPVGSLGWDTSLATARLLLKGGASC
jgi:hypothetical protein